MYTYQNRYQPAFSLAMLFMLLACLALCSTSMAQTGHASRYWDGCKPQCSWIGNAERPIKSCGISNQSLAAAFSAQDACQGGDAYTCWDMSPKQITPQLAYGFAAVPANGDVCGKCYQLNFTGEGFDNKDDSGSQALAAKNKQMIIMASNTGHELSENQFDLLIPGGGAGQYSTCSSQWDVSNTQLGAQYGGFLTSCQNRLGVDAKHTDLKTCVSNQCDLVFNEGSMSDLNRGCHWFVDWFELADKPKFEYEEVACPNALVDIAYDNADASTDLTTNKAASQTAEKKASSQRFSENSEPLNTGVATHFEVFGYPFGGCGVPENLLETSNFVALNVYDTPNWYEFPVRPLKGDDLSYMGEFANGYNCGRWVEVTIEENCIGGYNGGEPNRGICSEGGRWIADDFSGAKLTMLVGDSCGDNNGWCRDSKYHLDLATSSLNKFIKNGQMIGNLYPSSWNNRKISWRYIKAPNYSGDIAIYFLQGAGKYWPTIMINQLENGIHGVERLVDGQWISAERNSDMGQTFILPTNDSYEFTIRVLDSQGQYIHNGRQYSFSFPASCGEKCTAITNQVSYVSDTTDTTDSNDENSNNQNENSDETDAEKDNTQETNNGSGTGQLPDSTQNPDNATDSENPPGAEDTQDTGNNPTKPTNTEPDNNTNSPESGSGQTGTSTDGKQDAQQATKAVSIGASPMHWFGLLSLLMWVRLKKNSSP